MMDCLPVGVMNDSTADRPSPLGLLNRGGRGVLSPRDRLPKPVSGEGRESRGIMRTNRSA